MSCFFCYSNFHLTQNCDIYVSDKSRTKILITSNRCQFCLNIKDKNHTSTSCVSSNKCFKCLNKGHNFIFCINKSKVPNLFIPNIDADLFFRFSQTFDAMEKYSLAFAAPALHAATKTMKPLIVAKKVGIYSNAPRAFAHKKYYEYSLNLKKTSISTKKIELYYSTISSNDFYGLFLYNVEIFECQEVIFTSTITFLDLLQRMPNIENLKIASTTIKIANSWPNDLLKYKFGKNMSYLHIKIKTMDFCVKSLYDFMKKQKRMQLVVTLDAEFNVQSYQEEVINKLSPFFIPDGEGRLFSKEPSYLQIITAFKKNKPPYRSYGEFFYLNKTKKCDGL